MSPYYKRIPVWPLVVILGCVLVLSLVAPWRWYDGGRRQQLTLRHSGVPAGPVETQVPVAQPWKRDLQSTVSARPDPTENDVAIQLAQLGKLSGPPQLAVIAPPVAERIQRDPSIVETPPLPALQEPVAPSKAPNDATPPDESAVPQQRPELLLRDRSDILPPATTWPYPSALGETLNVLLANESSQPWAERVVSSLNQLGKIDSLGDPQVGTILSQLKRDKNEAAAVAKHADSPKIRSLVLRAAYGLERHLAIWQAVFQLATRPSIPVTSNDPRRLAEVVDTVSRRLKEISSSSAWRDYLLLSPLSDLAHQQGGIDAQELRDLARRILLRVESPSLTQKQSEFFTQPPFPPLMAELKRWASEPVDYQKLLRDIEIYERSGLADDAQRVVQYYQILRWSPDQQVASLAESLNTHYRNANVRVAISIDLINRLMPAPQHSAEAVSDNIAEADVQGQSWATTRLRITLLPDRRQWRMGLDADTNVTSDTESRKGPAAFFHDAWANVRARKELTVDDRGVRVGRAQAAASMEQNLKGFETDYDDLPVLNLFARSIAHKQYEEKLESSQVEAENKLAWRASSRFDSEVHARLAIVEKEFQTKLLKPLQELDLKPTAVDMETTDKRLVVRERLAGNKQLGAHTPRPQAPGDSWLSVQIHETAMNNALEHLGLDGRKTDLHSLFREMTRRFSGKDIPVPEDLPDDVKVHFADVDAVRVRCEHGRVRLTIRVAELTNGRNHWRNFIVQAFYKPTASQKSTNLERDGVIQLAGERLDFGDQVALRGIFSKVLSRNRNLSLVNKKLAENPKLADLRVTQFVIQDGWIGVAMSNSGVRFTLTDDTGVDTARLQLINPRR